jgi:hypothetical protein
MSATALQPGALAYTRLSDTTHLLYGVLGVEAVLFWADNTTGCDDAGEPQVFTGAWWLTFTDTPTQRVLLDAPAWPAEAADAEREGVITAARDAAAHLVAHHRHQIGAHPDG